jgi:LysR family transcriptional regulator for bpeEF and oprC
MDQLAAMRAFIRVAELESFAAAAEILDLSRAVVTTRIAQLEARLGVRLLHRTTRRVRLTDDGTAYYERCLRVLADLDEADEAVSRGRTAARGRLRVQLPVALGRTFLVPALPRFLAAHPALELEVRLANRDVDLVDEGIDCAVRLGVPHETHLVARRIADTRLATVASEGYLRAHGTPRTPDDLAGHNCIAFLDLASGRPVDWAFEQDGRRILRSPQGNLAFNSMEAAVEAAAAGVGVAQVLWWLAAPAFAAGRLEAVLTDIAAAGPPLYVAYPHHRHLSAKTRAFVDFAAEVFGGAVPSAAPSPPPPSRAAGARPGTAATPRAPRSRRGASQGSRPRRR